MKLEDIVKHFTYTTKSDLFLPGVSVTVYLLDKCHLCPFITHINSPRRKMCNVLIDDVCHWSMTAG